jgi:hypothetical protein
MESLGQIADEGAITRSARTEAPRRRPTAGAKWLGGGMVALCLIATVDWSSTTTHRLYVDEDSQPSRQAGTVWQHFGIRGNNVTPEIITNDNARFVFPIRLRMPHKLVFRVEPEGVCSYEIFLSVRGERRLIASETISGPRSRAISIPRGEGALEFVEHGSLAWIDPRLVRGFFLWPAYAVIFAGLIAQARKVRWPDNSRQAEWLTLAVALTVGLVGIESILRLCALRLPPVIISARHELGLVGPDPRWIASNRYKLRLSPNLNTYCEWRYGDIVRLGFIPSTLSPGVIHRYPLRTDAEGFRNATVREKIEVAALGDSFTDAITSRAEEAWPARLEELTGRPVQNYGTSGFGPQQELYVLHDYALRHKPHWVVLAYFSGNDLYDAEAFDHWQHAVDRAGEEVAGWRLKRSFRRYETLYLWTTGCVAAQSISAHQSAEIAIGTEPLHVSTPQFDRGLFRIPIAGDFMQFAFLPPYLQKISATRPEIESSAGWRLTQSTLRQMKTECELGGTNFLVMFVPTKAQVYWPLLERSFPSNQLQEAVDYYCRYNHMPLRVEQISANRLALNAVMHDFCARENIPMLDLTAAEAHEVELGRTVYFPDDTHWNAAGQDVAARELARFLTLHP